jgi:hypothetical protein
MKRGAQFALGLSALCLCFFVFGITDVGQVVLRGQIPQNVTHWQLDDIYMGAGLAPWVYGLGLSLLSAFIGSGCCYCAGSRIANGDKPRSTANKRRKLV